MPKGILFWVIYIICLLFCLWAFWPLSWSASTLVLFVLIGLLGWAVFGAPVQ